MIRRDILLFRTFCVIFWIGATLGCLIQFIPPLEAIYRPVYLVLDPLFLLCGLLTLRRRCTIILTAIFFAILIISSLLVNKMGMLNTFNGFRDFIPLLFSVPLIQYFFTCPDKIYIRQSFDRQLKLFLYLQAFIVPIQFLRYGAGDSVGGTFGEGGSGYISVLIVIISFYFVNKDWNPEQYLQSLKRNIRYVTLLFPIMLNETKISFVLLAIYFALLYRAEARSIVKLALAMPIIAVVASVLMTVYSNATNQERDEVFSESFLTSYLIGNEDIEEYLDMTEKAIEEDLDKDDFFNDMPRFYRNSLMTFIVGDNTAGAYLLGAGAGHFRGQSMMSPTPFFEEYAPLLSGTNTMYLIIYVQLGLLGLIWSFVWFLFALRPKHNYDDRSIPVKLFCFSLFVISLFYNTMFTNIVLTCVIFYVATAYSYPQPTAAEIRESEAKGHSLVVRNV